MKKATKFLLILIITLAYQTISTSSFAQGVGINADGSSAHGSAMLDVKSTTSGVIIPRMTTAQRDNIATACSCIPVEGLLIFNTTTKCFEAFVNGAWNTVSCPAACTPPVAPTSNAASGIGCISFTANWSASTGATSYFLDVATDAGFTSFVTGYNNLNVGNVQTQNIASLTAGTTYYYRVRAYNACASGNSNTITTTTSAAPASAPTAGTHTPSQTQIVWNWNTVSGATGYKYNTTNNYGTATDNGASISNTQTSLTCNTAYTLYVWAYNSCGNSAATSLTQTTSSCCTLIASAGSNLTTSCVVIGGAPTASGGTPGYTYAWNPSTGLSSSTVANPTANPASSTTYSVTVSDAGGCTATSSMTITITPTLLNNMVSYWKFDESSGNASDATGNGNTLTNINTVTYGTGKINNCAVFNGSTQVFTQSINFVENITINAWFKTSVTNQYQSIISWLRYNSFTDYDAADFRLSNTGKIQYTNGGQSGNWGGDVIADPSAYPTGTLIMATITVDASRLATLYVNGVQVAQITMTSMHNFTPDAGKTTVGGCGDGFGNGGRTQFFNGSLDEIGLWSRALSACEVSALYNSGNGLQHPF